MLSYIVVLIGLPLFLISWMLFQQWLAKTDSSYKGYQAGCGGCSRSCNSNSNSNSTSKLSPKTGSKTP